MKADNAGERKIMQHSPFFYGKSSWWTTSQHVNSVTKPYTFPGVYFSVVL